MVKTDRELESDELNHNTTWTFSEPLLFEEQVERIEKGEYKSKLSSLQKVMDSEYEHHGIKLFYDVSKRRNTFANQGREILRTLPNENTTNRLHKASEAELEKTLNDMRGIRDWEDIVQETNTSKISSSSCLIDSLSSSESCMERAEGTVCIFPKVIVKQVSNYEDYNRELTMHHELSDTRYFPQLYEFGQEDQSCLTLYIENVGDHQNHPNVWTSNYTYYSTFINNAFSIFEEKRIIPFDLNLCCNIIANGLEIRIIDFGKYRFESKNDTRLHEESEKIRLELLEGLTNEIQQHQDKSVFQRGEHHD